MPGLFSSAVSLTVIWFMSLSLCPSVDLTWTSEVSSMQYGRLNSNVTLSCGKSQCRLPVFWHLNNSSLLPWHKVTSEGALVLLHVDQSAQGNYSCYDRTGLLIHSVTLRLGHPPGLLDIACQVPNHTYVHCSWMDSVKTFLPAKYNASFKLGQDWKPCILDIPRKRCEVYDPPFWQTVNTVKITETNVLGSETSYADFKLYELLKPDPPEAVMANELEGFPQKLVISWSHPSSWEKRHGFPLLFQIRYRPEGSEYWSEVLSPENSVVISDTLVGHVHQVQVRAKDEINPDSQWSEWTPLLLVKAWKVSTTPDPALRPEEMFPEYTFHFNTKPATTTPKSNNRVQGEDGNVGLVILLTIFSVVIFTAIFTLIIFMWLRQKRRDEATKQKLSSMVKMKSMPI